MPSYLRLEKTQETFTDNTYKCTLKIFDDKEQYAGSWTVCTGQGYAQKFRQAGRNIPGSMEPLPQGIYEVFDMEWAGGKDNWGVSHGPGLGPVFVPIVCREETRRGEFGIHIDYNRGSSSGTAGCIGVLDEQDMVEIVQHLRTFDPKVLRVEWEL